MLATQPLGLGLGPSVFPDDCAPHWLAVGVKADKGWEHCGEADADPALRSGGGGEPRERADCRRHPVLRRLLGGAGFWPVRRIRLALPEEHPPGLNPNSYGFEA